MSKKLVLAILAALLCATGCSGRAPLAKDILIMDTFVHIEIRDSNASNLKAQAVDKAAGRMRDLERRFDAFKKGSELAAINSLKVTESLAVSPEMFAVLKLSKGLCEKSNGAFDITTGQADNWSLDEANKTLSIKKEGVKIDLGGAAKGYIVDEGIRVLKESGVTNGLINAGGDLYCMGEGAQPGGWRIGIRDPRNKKEIIGAFTVSDKGVATSGVYERPSHIINPATGKPRETALKSVTVIADTCMEADALATALFVMDTSDGLALTEGTEGAECVMIIGENGLKHASSGMEARLYLTK